MIRKSGAKKKIVKAQNGKAVADATYVKKSPMPSQKMATLKTAGTYANKASDFKNLADLNMRASINSTTKPGGSYGDTEEMLNHRAGSLYDSADKYQNKSDSAMKAYKSQRNGGKTPLKKIAKPIAKKSVAKKSITKSKKK